MLYKGKYKNEITFQSIVEYILTRRGIPKNEVEHYLNLNSNDICDYKDLGVDKLKAAADLLMNAIDAKIKTFILVDADADGYTSSALLLNWLNRVNPDYAQNNIKYYMHEGKQHGLNDCVDQILEGEFKLVIIADAGTNDVEETKQLEEAGIPVIILDHHELEGERPHAILINNQCSDYPNKQLSGVGIVWQFLRYIETEVKPELDELKDFLDIVAVGNCSDMMSLTSFETTYILRKGFQQLKNPFIYGIAQKNAYSIGDKVTPIKCAFYITPFINAIVRSGTIEEKKLVFNSMLEYKAFEKILSNKRGHKPGEMEYLYEQALRTATNVKNRQTKAQEKGMACVEGLIEKNDMLNHKALIFYLEDSAGIEANLRGLVANKLMAKYQRPCAILTKSKQGYAGSARGYTKSGIENFKDICEGFEHCAYAIGHQSAHGLCIEEGYKEDFVNYLDKVLADVGTEPVYNCDIIYNGDDVDGDDILQIAELSDLWGQDIDEPLLCIKDVSINKDMVNVYRKRDNTLKITLPNGVVLLKFRASDEECDTLTADGWKTLTIVGKANKNEWNGNISPQIFIEDYTVADGQTWVF